MICKYFLPGFSLSFHSLNILLQCKCFKFWWSPFVILQMDHAFDAISKNSLPNPRSWRFFFLHFLLKVLKLYLLRLDLWTNLSMWVKFITFCIWCSVVPLIEKKCSVFHWIAIAIHWVWKPKKQECQCLGRQRWIAQLKQEGKFTLPTIFCFVWVLKRLDDAHLYWGRHLLYSAHWFKC